MVRNNPLNLTGVGKVLIPLLSIVNPIRIGVPERQGHERKNRALGYPCHRDTLTYCKDLAIALMNGKVQLGLTRLWGT
jgi:hypothetical protein